MNKSIIPNTESITHKHTNAPTGTHSLLYTNLNTTHLLSSKGKATTVLNKQVSNTAATYNDCYH